MIKWETDEDFALQHSPEAKEHTLPNKIIQSGNKRYVAYIAAGVVMVAAIVATLITMGMFTIDDVNQWIALVVTLVVAIVGLAQSVLSALNTDREDDTPGAHAAE